jgi:hypothetical protein
LAIGQALQRLGRFQDALYRFQRYLRENPDGPDRDFAENGIAVAQAALIRDAEAAGVPPPPPPPEIAPEVLVAKMARAPKTNAAAIAATPPLSRQDPWDEQSRTTVGVWIVAGVGIAALVGWGWWMLRKPKPRAAIRANRRWRR